ncbi:hypothetical protein ACWD01_36405 [Streptomyces sp. NPDC002835]|jgi:tryptophan 2,3-dioxygenase
MRAVLESREKAALMRMEELRAEFERVKRALAEAEPMPAAGPRRVVARRESGVPAEVLDTDNRRIMTVSEDPVRAV